MLDQDPCGLLNTASYPSLWAATSYSMVATYGVTNTYSSALATNKDKEDTLLLSGRINRDGTNLIQFLSGGGVGAATGKDYSKFKNVYLGTAGSPSTIIDTVFHKSDYTYSVDANPKISDADISSALSYLTGNYLISTNELYKEADMTSPVAGQESLIYLYQISQRNNSLSAAQLARRNTLESKNLRFFGAFIAEYCFYRTRYEFLLGKFFEIYSTPPTSYNTSSTLGKKSTDPVMALFSGSGPGENQYVETSDRISQSDYLKGIVFHMACLNTRLIDLRRLLGAITSYYSTTHNLIQNAVNNGVIIGSNADLRNKILSLTESSSGTQKYLQQQDFHKGIMEYTLEKNKYSNILLGLYALLNISAVAAIIHLNT